MCNCSEFRADNNRPPSAHNFIRRPQYMNIYRDRCHWYVSTSIGKKMSRPAVIDQREYKKRGTINTTVVVVILSSFNVVRHPGRLSASETSFFLHSVFRTGKTTEKKIPPNETRNGLLVNFFHCSHRD